MTVCRGASELGGGWGQGQRHGQGKGQKQETKQETKHGEVSYFLWRFSRGMDDAFETIIGDARADGGQT